MSVFTGFNKKWRLQSNPVQFGNKRKEYLTSLNILPSALRLVKNVIYIVRWNVRNWA